ncbi:hypothetical protein Btru_067317, partial [Bulinus truncatus]
MEKYVYFDFLQLFSIWVFPEDASAGTQVSMKLSGRSTHCENGGYVLDLDLFHVKGRVVLSDHNTTAVSSQLTVEFTDGSPIPWQELCSFRLVAPERIHIIKSVMGCYCTSYDVSAADFFLNFTAKNYSALRAVLTDNNRGSNYTSEILKLPGVFGEPIMFAYLDKQAIRPYGNCSLVVEEGRDYKVSSCYKNLNVPMISISISGHHLFPESKPCLTKTLSFTPEMTAVHFAYSDQCGRSKLYECKLYISTKTARLAVYKPWILPLVASTMALPTTIYIL